MGYQEFVDSKLKVELPRGLEVVPELPSGLFPFQAHCVGWGLQRGRAALFEDCGLGKTFQELVWAQKLVEHTGKRVLVLAPLGVTGQTVREGKKFGIEIAYAKTGDEAAKRGITITNYERLAAFNPDDFVAVVLDESSILKSFSGATKKALLAAFVRTPHRLACTATPSPNDLLELGNHAEFLGILTSHEMLARWFLPDTSHAGKYRLKGHAVEAFWDWVSSWARCVGTPSDIGFSDEGYVLPDLIQNVHVVDVDITTDRGDGELFRKQSLSATAIHKEKRLTLAARAAKIAEVVSAEPGEPWIIWCETDYEDDAIRKLLPEAVSVKGSDSLESKEASLLGFADGSIRVLITKAKIGGFGLNWQHCARVAYIGPTFSFEQFYQTVRRCHRFGQTRPVQVHVVMGSTEVDVWSTMMKKANAHEAMKVEMYAAMKRALERRDESSKRYNPTHLGTLPRWISERRA